MRAAVRAVVSSATIALVATAILLVARSGCPSGGHPPPKPGELVEVATSDASLWTGVAVTPSGRLFVSYPLWVGPHTASVVELFADGRQRMFPDPVSNSWRPGAEYPL